ncbi:MAG: hypothetical protein ACLQDV_10530 [Candidatus Binataceae bacterium]
MSEKTEKDFWIEMSILEISTQARFANLAYQNIDPKAQRGTDAIFSSIHSFLSHCAMISKMLQANDGEKPATSIGEILDIDASSVIHERKFRNGLEHYDERLKRWIGKFAAGASIGTHIVAPKAAFAVPDMVFVSQYDPGSTVFTFLNEEFDLGVLHLEVQRIGDIVENWITGVKVRNIEPPFDESRPKKEGD